MGIMRGHRAKRGALAIVMLCMVPALATLLDAFVLGGGNADKDCRVAFGGVDATDGESGVVCTDGDPACDTDGVADGSCRFDVSLCTGVAVPGCTPEPISSITVAGLPLALPPLPSTAGAFCARLDVVVPAGAPPGGAADAPGGGGPPEGGRLVPSFPPPPQSLH